jgi:hypothetical protein
MTVVRTYNAYRELLASPRWRKLAAAGARPQRLLWAWGSLAFSRHFASLSATDRAQPSSSGLEWSRLTASSTPCG